MEHVITDFENKKQGIRKYLKHLDNSCRSHFGPNNKHISPIKYPYRLKDVEEYKARILDNLDEKTYIQRNCKFLSGVTKDTDEERRYFKEATTEAECNMVNGFWDPNAVNRKNKFDVGVCWYTDKDKECGSQTDLRMLRPYHSKFKDLSEARLEQAAKCDAVPGCTWKQQTGYTWDCVKGQKVEEQGPAMNPPKDMPVRDGLEDFIYRWYNSDTSPLTTDLIGEGNRCKGVILEENAEPPEKLLVKEYIDYRLLNPGNKKDSEYLKKVLSTKMYYQYVDDWTELQRVGSEKFNKMHKGTSMIDNFYNKMDYNQFMEDIPVSEQKKAQKKGTFPSVPQSVVNMVMKHVVQTDGERRGMLAWHSTGSGKCHAKDTPILMYDGTIKMVQDIRENDVLMGDDSTPRRVLSLASGQDEMYDIIPTKGEKYTVNAAHILCLKYDVLNKDIEKFRKPDGVIEIEVADFILLDKTLQEELKAYITCVDFEASNISFRIQKFHELQKEETRDYYKVAGIKDPKEIILLCRSLGYYSYLDEDGNIVIMKSNEYNFDVKHVGRGDYYGFTLDGNNRYLLGDFTVTHNTCTATGVMDSFWDTDRPIIFASSIDAIASNPDYKFHECAMNLYPRFQQGEFKGNTKEESMALVAAAFKKRNVKFLSFAKLSNRVVNALEYKKLHKIGRGGAPKKAVAAKATDAAAKKKPLVAAKGKVSEKPAVAAAKTKAVNIQKKPMKAVGAKTKSHSEILEGEQYVDLDNAILIIDEVHNLFRPLPNQAAKHKRLEKEILDPRKHPNMKVVILTATPGDNIPDVLKLLNIIRNPKEPEIKLDSITSEEDIAKFKEQIRGMVSYFDMSSDTTKFPIVNDKQEFIKVPMGETQFAKYIEAYKSVKGDQKNFNVLAKNNKISKYWEAPRKYSNMLFNFDKDMGLSDFSNKMPVLLENINNFPAEKHYVYSAFYTKMGYGGQGIVGIAKELEKKGYKKLTVTEAKKLNAVGKLPAPGKRYILAITTEIGEEGGSAGKNLGELIKIYNSPENKNGALIHVMLASQGFNEGIDLKAVRHIHFFEPLVTMASDKQTLGRAARYCSHADLDRDKGEWVVQIHRYMSDKPPLAVAPDNSVLIAQLQAEIVALNEQILHHGNKKKDIQERIKEVKKITKAKKKESDSGDIGEMEDILEKITIATKGMKDLIKEKEKDLKVLTTVPKKKTLDPGSVENIEEIIFKESRERMKELLTVYQCMKEAAVDCKVLAEFHSSTGHAVKCAF